MEWLEFCQRFKRTQVANMFSKHFNENGVNLLMET